MLGLLALWTLLSLLSLLSLLTTLTLLTTLALLTILTARRGAESKARRGSCLLRRYGLGEIAVDGALR